MPTTRSTILQGPVIGGAATIINASLEAIGPMGFLETGQGQQTAISKAAAFVFDSRALTPFAIGWLEAYVLPNHTSR